MYYSIMTISFILLFLLSGCSESLLAINALTDKKAEAKAALGGETVNSAVSAPSSMKLNVSAISNDSKPALTIDGVKAGATVKVYTDDKCAKAVASGTAAAETIDLKTQALNEGSYTFYSNQIDPSGVTSKCSSANVNYIYDSGSASAPQKIEAVSSNSNAATLTINIEGVEVGSTVKLCLDSGCVNIVATGTSTGESIVLTTDVLPGGDNVIYSQQTDAVGNTSPATPSAPISVTSQTAPSLDAIANQTLDEGNSITPIDANDAGDDKDSDSQALSYTCFYDKVVDGSVSSTACSGLTGLSFNSSNGKMTWNTSTPQAASYEFKIVASDGDKSDSELFTITVASIAKPFVSKWKTTSANEQIKLPLRSGYTYNFTVDWGDGSPVSTVTASNDSDRNHTYASAGTYTVKIDGVAETWYFSNTGSKDKIISVDDLGDTGLITLENAFYGCSNLTSFSGGETKNVTSMNSMFKYATKLSSIDLSSFNTEKVTSMEQMFRNSTELVTADLSSFNTAKVTTMVQMFYNASKLTTANLTSFNTLEVLQMDQMFDGAEKLDNLDLSSFVTTKVTNMSKMFRDTTVLSTLDISNFDTQNVIIMNEMFRGASSITSLDLSHFNISKVDNINYMFRDASSITSIDLRNWNDTGVSSAASVFLNMSGTVTCDVHPVSSIKEVFSKSCL